MADDVARVLRWITELFARRGVPYQAVGGLAARAHGATRPLADLDFYVPADALRGLLPELEPHLTKPLHRHADRRWDVEYVQAVRYGTPVEIAAAEGARYRAGDGTWHDASIDFDAGVLREVLGVPVRVMPREALIRYKRRLAREVDLRDLEEMGQAP